MYILTCDLHGEKLAQIDAAEVKGGGIFCMKSTSEEIAAYWAEWQENRRHTAAIREWTAAHPEAFICEPEQILPNITYTRRIPKPGVQEILDAL